MLRKAYRYKLEPNTSQRYALARALEVCRELYNNFLYQQKCSKSVVTNSPNNSPNFG